jgi:hypothetical protein
MLMVLQDRRSQRKIHMYVLRKRYLGSQGPVETPEKTDSLGGKKSWNACWAVERGGGQTGKDLAGDGMRWR